MPASGKLDVPTASAFMAVPKVPPGSGVGLAGKGGFSRQGIEKGGSFCHFSPVLQLPQSLDQHKLLTPLPPPQPPAWQTRS